MNKKFQSREEVDEYLSGDEIHCLICGKPLKVLFPHLYWKHGRMKVDDYKVKYGLPLSYGAVAKSVSSAMATRMRGRMETGVINPISKETAWQGQHAKKRMPASYHIKALKEKGFKESQKRKVESVERINSIDWDAFLNEVEASGKAHWGVRDKDGMPSFYSFQRKSENDPAFAKKYNGLVDSMKLKNRYREMVLQMTGEGMSQSQISALLRISESHIGRIRREQLAGL